MKSLRSKFLFLFFLFVISKLTLYAQNAWINEFHYDNASSDEGEFVEVVLEDASSYDLSLFTILLYNGSDGETYGSSHTLDSFTEGITENGFTIFYKNISGIQNGDDAFSLDYNGTLIQFISYEGTFTAVGGPADGILSTDVGLEETTSTPVGESLQLSGVGTNYSEFTWEEPAVETKGALNAGQNFGSACSPPTAQASFSTLSTGEIDDNQISLSWSRGDGDGVVILAKESNAVNEIPQNGNSYSADVDFSSGLADEIGTGNFVVYDGADTTAVITGLTKGTAYHFAIFEYLSTDQCYLTESETISVTTTTSFDDDSEIKAPAIQIASTDISSIANSETEAVEVFEIEISDKGTSDGEPTLIQNMVIEKSSDNEVSDWSSVIKGAKLNDGTSDLTISNLSINEDNIEFDLSGNEFSVADGTTERLTLSIWLNETQADGDTIGFEIPETHGFGTDISGSLLSNPISSSITSNPFLIEVEATNLEIITASNALVNEAINLSARAVDVNNNTDLASRNLSLNLNTGSGNLISPSVGLGPLAMNDGFYEWTDLEYDSEESIIIEVSDGNGLSVNTAEIDIMPLITSVFISEYIEGSSSNKALEVFNNSGEIIELDDFSLAKYTNGSESISSEYQLSNIQDSLADQGNLVIANTSADSILQEIADTTQFSVTNFNGDDALALLYKGNIIDLIGEIGVDPGSGWEVAGISEATQNKTLVRKASVTEGNADSLDSFGNNSADSEWVVYDIDEFSYLGDHFRCDAPIEQVSNVSTQNISETTAELNWTTPTNLHAIVLINEGAAVNFPPISGNDYTANADFTLSDELGEGNKIVFAGNGENVSISNLNSGTTYRIAIYAYDDVENCYNIDSPAIESFTTEIALDEDSEISDLTQPSVTSLFSTIDEESEAQEVFSFQIADIATKDTAATLIKKMVFESGSSNSLAWKNTLNAILKDGNGKIDNAEVSIVNDSVKIDFAENSEYEIPPGESVDFALAIWFNRFELSDTQQFALKIPAEHEFLSSDSGSMLLSTLADSISSNEIEIIEAFDQIQEIRNGQNGITYVTRGFVSSNDFGLGDSQFYIQKDESTTYEQGIAIYSDQEIPNISLGNRVKILGSREEVNGSVRLNADTVIVLENDEGLPETYSVSPTVFQTNSELIGTRVRLDSVLLTQSELWGDFAENVLSFTKGQDTILVNIQPNNIYFNGNAQPPLGAVDLEGVVENRNDSIQLIVSLDSEISDLYSPIFETDPQISNIQSEKSELIFSVNELSTVYYAVKNVGDSVPDLQVLKSPQSDAQIVNSGNMKIELEEVRDSISLSIENLSSNTEYSIFLVAEDTVGNASEVSQLDFFTLNAEADKDVHVVEASEQISATEIKLVESSQNLVPVFNFTVVDGGTSDALSTFISRMVIHSSVESEADYVDVISEIQLYDLSNDTVITTQNAVFSDSIVFEIPEVFELDDGDSNTFQLKIRLNEMVEDEKNIAFAIPEDAAAWQVGSYGSQLAESFVEPVISSVHSINVVASDLNISYPSEVFVDEGFDISINAEDIYGNIDITERALSILTESEDSLSGQTTLNLIHGVGVFEDLSFDQKGLFTFEFTDGSLSEIIEINFIQPEIYFDTANFDSDFGLVTFPDSSEIKSYQLSAENLKDSILIVAPNGFQLSLDPDFTNHDDSLIFENESFTESEIFVRFSPIENDSDFYQGSILHISKDADTVLLPVSGQEGTLSLSTIAGARNKSMGERIKVHGVVVGGENQFEDKRIIQDETAGIVVQGLNSADLKFGDSVEVEGVVNKSNAWLSLFPETEVNILSTDSIVVDPLLKSIGEVNASLEFQRIRIENLNISGEGKFASGEYFVIDENSDSLIFILNRDDHPLVDVEIPFGKVNVTGFIGRRNDAFKIYPEFVQDLDIIPRDTILIIEAPTAGFSFGDVFLDEISEPQSYSLRAENLSENLSISTSENFEISLLSESNYSNELELPINERGDIPLIDIYVHFLPVAAKGGEISGEINHVSGGKENSIPLVGVEDMITLNYATVERSIVIYPNPVVSELRIEMLESQCIQYELIGLSGEKILEGDFSSSHLLNLNALESGVYLLKFSDGTSEYYRRIIKK